MPPTVPQHPSAADLTDFALGKLAPTAAEWIARHLDECPACRRVAEQAPNDALVALLRRPDAPVASTPSGHDGDTHGTGSAPDPAPDDVPPALRDHPRYRVVRHLGRGGMGVVYQAEHTVMERPVAIKVISRALLDRPDAVERFHREVRAAAKLDHPNIVKAYDAEQAGELHFLAMEYVEGKSLADVLDKKGPLPVAHACHYARQAAQGLQHAFEKGMVHRDIKPHNLMLTPKGVVKILDFGLAKLASEQTGSGAGLTHDNAVMGTPEYLAPEQAVKTKDADIRADIYALGCTLFHLLTGRPPFAGDNPLAVVVAHVQDAPPPVESLRPDVPPELAALVARMLAKNPADRPQTPKEVADALQPFAKPGKAAPPPLTIVSETAPAAAATTERTAAPSVTAPPPPRPRRRRKKRPTGSRWLIPAAVAGVLAVVGVALWAGGVFRVKTPHGTIVLTVNEPGAEVAVDGEAVKVTPAGGQPVEITARPGQTLQVTKGGFTAFTKELTLAPGTREELEVRLEPLAAPPAAAGGPPVPDGPQRVALVGRGAWAIDGSEVLQRAVGANTNLRFGDGRWTDYDFSFEVCLIGGNGNAGAIFRSAQSSGVYLFLVGGGSNGEDVLVHGYGGKYTNILTRKNPRAALQPGRWRRVRVRVRGAECWCSLDGDEVFHRRDLAVHEGRVGLKTVDTACRFRELRVTAPDGSVLWAGPPTLPTDLEPVPTLPPAAGFVPLFNGTDLSGWKAPGDGPRGWRVKDGVLAGAGGGGPSFLYTDREYADFHLRAVARINGGGNGGICFRSGYGPPPRGGPFPVCYDAKFDVTGVDTDHKTGSLYAPGRGGVVAVRTSPVGPNEWFTVEVIAAGEDIEVKVNGVRTAAYTDPRPRLRRGHVALHRLDAQSVVEFRAVEIKELPPPSPGEGFVPLFNGIDLAGWEPYPGGGAHWSVENGAIVGRGGRGMLFSKRGDYADFHIRAEAKAGPGANSGVFFRLPYTNDSKAGYEAQIDAGKDPFTTGSLYGIAKTTVPPPPADTWFTIEVIARGRRIQILVNGRQTVDYVDPKPRSLKGFFALQQQAPGREIRFRKVEVRELK